MMAWWVSFLSAVSARAWRSWTDPWTNRPQWTAVSESAHRGPASHAFVHATCLGCSTPATGRVGVPRNHRLAPTAGVGWCRPPTADRTLTGVMAVLAGVATSCIERPPPAILCSSQNRSRHIQRRRRTEHARTPAGGSDRGDSVADRCPGGRPAGPDIWHRPGPSGAGHPSARPTHTNQRGVAALGLC
jgi:hypothetical protein